MTAGMAEVIAAHGPCDSFHRCRCGSSPHHTEPAWVIIQRAPHSHATWHAAHVAEELVAAGYGKLAPHGVD